MTVSHASRHRPASPPSSGGMWRATMSGFSASLQRFPEQHLTVIVLCAEEHRPWRRVLLGPVTAAVFLLRGMAVLMPAVIMFAVVAATGRAKRRRSGN